MGDPQDRTPQEMPHDLSPLSHHLPGVTQPQGLAGRGMPHAGGCSSQLASPPFTLKTLKSRQYQGFLLHLRWSRGLSAVERMRKELSGEGSRGWYSSPARDGGSHGLSHARGSRGVPGTANHPLSPSGMTYHSPHCWHLRTPALQHPLASLRGTGEEGAVE